MKQSARSNHKPKIFGMRIKWIILIIIAILVIRYCGPGFLGDRVVKQYCGKHGLLTKQLCLYGDKSYSYFYGEHDVRIERDQGGWEVRGDTLFLNGLRGDTVIQNNYLIRQRILQNTFSSGMEFAICDHSRGLRVKRR